MLQRGARTASANRKRTQSTCLAAYCVPVSLRFAGVDLEDRDVGCIAHLGIQLGGPGCGEEDKHLVIWVCSNVLLQDAEKLGIDVVH